MIFEVCSNNPQELKWTQINDRCIVYCYTKLMIAGYKE